MDQASMKKLAASDGSKFNFQYTGTYGHMEASLKLGGKDHRNKIHKPHPNFSELFV
jgi:hypothetical protein